VTAPDPLPAEPIATAGAPPAQAVAPSATPVGQPPPSEEEKFTALLAWGLNFFVPVLGPYLLWRYQAKDSRFVEHHARASSNHALTVMLLFLIACVVLGGPAGYLLYSFDPTTETEYYLYFGAIFGLLGLVLLVMFLLGLATLVIHLVALVRAGRGEWYVPRLCWRIVR
jgi:uncharacterized Tic20 family protein